MAQNVCGLLVAGMLIAISGRHAAGQTSSVQPSAPTLQAPAYEVATIKPAEPNGYASHLRVYVQAAFGIPVNSVGWVLGPDWINSTRYVIRGKPSDSDQAAMQTMKPEERSKQLRLMNQTLLADRFKLKAHFETREMPVYQLIVAKEGSNLKENPDLNQGQVAVGASLIRGKAVPMHKLIDCLESLPEIGGRVVIDKTGLYGTYDLLLKWAPLGAATPSGGLGGTAPLPDAGGVSFFTAIEEQLGLKLVPSKEQEQVLVIDHIERPSEN